MITIAKEDPTMKLTAKEKEAAMFATIKSYTDFIFASLRDSAPKPGVQLITVSVFAPELLPCGPDWYRLKSDNEIASKSKLKVTLYSPIEPTWAQNHGQYSADIIIIISNDQTSLDRHKSDALDYASHNPTIVCLPQIEDPYQSWVIKPTKNLLIKMLNAELAKTLSTPSSYQAITSGYWDNRQWYSYAHKYPVHITRHISAFLSVNDLIQWIASSTPVDDQKKLIELMSQLITPTLHSFDYLNTPAMALYQCMVIAAIQTIYRKNRGAASSCNPLIQYPRSWFVSQSKKKTANKLIGVIDGSVNDSSLTDTDIDNMFLETKYTGSRLKTIISNMLTTGTFLAMNLAILKRVLPRHQGPTLFQVKKNVTFSQLEILVKKILCEDVLNEKDLELYHATPMLKDTLLGLIASGCIKRDALPRQPDISLLPTSNIPLGETKTSA